MNKMLSSVAVAGLALAAAACDSTTEVGGSGQTSLSFTSQSQAALFAPQMSVMDTLVLGGHTVAVNAVDLTVSKVELKGDSVEIEMKSNNLTFSVPMNGSVVTPISVPALPGVYDELEFKIQAVRLQGTFDGQPFDATIRVETKIEQDIDPPLVVGADGKANVTLALNAAHWFITNQGVVLDPRNLTAEQRAQIMSNIKASFRAFDDDNRNGHHDDEDDDDEDSDDDDD